MGELNQVKQALENKLHQQSLDRARAILEPILSKYGCDDLMPQFMDSIGKIQRNSRAKNIKTSNSDSLRVFND